MDISLFDYELQSDLIAQKPCSPRDNSRLLASLGGDIKDLRFRDLHKLLDTGDVLVINDTKVIPTRLFGKRDNVKVEVTLHLNVKNNLWRSFVKPGRKCKIDDIITFKNNLRAKVINKYLAGDVLLEFNQDHDALLRELDFQGSMPLPPYIKRDLKIDSDKHDYQTIFASNDGAVAAPTAGLHFTDELREKLDKKGVVFAPVTLHVGAGTFLPVKVTNIFEHKMHEEWGEINQNTSLIINNAKKNNKRIISVGTTSLRILETVAKINNGKIIPWSGSTNLYITPGFDFRIVDLMITNFHLPKSTLLMLVSAFHGKEKIFRCYQHAIIKKYRFFSYGDSCIFSKEDKK